MLNPDTTDAAREKARDDWMKRHDVVEWHIGEAFLAGYDAARAEAAAARLAGWREGREAAAVFTEVQRNDIPATGREFAAAIRALPESTPEEPTIGPIKFVIDDSLPPDTFKIVGAKLAPEEPT